MTADTKPTKKKAADEVTDRLRRAILSGDFEVGTHLPGERELSERLGISRLTLRSAIARLRAEGLVRPEHGAGTRVLDYRESGGVDLIGYLAQHSLEGGQVPLALLHDLLEVRRMVAVEMLGLVTERAEPLELAEMRRHLVEQTALVDDADAFVRADLLFARLLVRSSKNLALELLFNTIQRIVNEHRGFEAAFLVNTQGTLRAYDRLLDLVEKRDPRRVRKMTRRLLTQLDRVTLDRLAALTGLTHPLDPEHPKPPTTQTQEKAQ